MTEQDYLLVCLAEEASEVAKAATKIIRFGQENRKAGRETTNLEELATEFCDMMAIIEMLMTRGLDISKFEAGEAHIKEKKARVERFMADAKRDGVIT